MSRKRLGAVSAAMIDVFSSLEIKKPVWFESAEFSGGETVFGVSEKVGGTD